MGSLSPFLLSTRYESQTQQVTEIGFRFCCFSDGHQGQTFNGSNVMLMRVTMEITSGAV